MVLAVDVDAEIEHRTGGHRRHRLPHLFDEHAHVDRADLELEPTRLDLLGGQEILDQGEEHLTFPVDDREDAFLLRYGLLVGSVDQHLDVSHHSGERTPELVRDLGDDVGLGPPEQLHAVEHLQLEAEGVRRVGGRVPQALP